MKLKLTAAMLALAAAPALAQDVDLTATGDAAAGEAKFRQCATCHVVTDPDGNTLAGSAARTGPNLYGIAGRIAGTVPEFRYSEALQAASEKGLIWNEESFVAYIQDPAAYLHEYLGDPSLRNSMTFKVRKAEDALNLYAYILSLAPPEAAASN